MNLIYNLKEEMSINEVLNREFHLSSRLKNKLIRSENILLNGLFVDTRCIAKPNDIITICLDFEEDNSNIISKKMNLDIVFEDSHLLVINKPYGIAIHPSYIHYNNSLSNGVKYYFDIINLKKKIRVVNRLDANTSGLVLFAKNEYVQECLIHEMSSHIFKKTYLALVEGKLNEKTGTINAPIARKENSIIERCVLPSRAKCYYSF